MRLTCLVWVAGVMAMLRPAGAETARPATPAPVAYAWEQKFFVAPPRELLAATKSVDDPTASYVVIFEERVHSFEADGKHRARYRRVYKVLTEAAVSGSGTSTVAASWAPWHESQPVMRARVVTRDGRAFTLDPKTIEISGSGDQQSDVFTDRHQLRAPLPGLAIGAVVEMEVASESGPVVAGLGSSNQFYFAEFVPVRASRLVLEAPPSLPLHVTDRGGGKLRSSRTEAGGRVRLVYEAGPMPAAEYPDDGWPDEVPVLPSIWYATGPGWREIAARYFDILDRQLAGADVRAWVQGAGTAGAPGRTSREGLIAALVARLHREIRYTGIEFGDASLIPRRPAEVLARGYGDCKDKAALLVALLRGAGITAQLALLKVQGLDVDPKLPAVDQFDHAIVYVPPAGKARALWIDATNPYALLGELPGGDADRRALLVSSRSDGLVTIPAAAAGQSRVRETRRVLLGETGHPRVVERTEADGAAARQFRASWSTTPSKDLEDTFTSYVKNQYLAKTLARMDVGTPADLTKPVALELEATDAEIGTVTGDGAVVVLRTGETLSRLPAGLRAEKDDPARAGKPRAVDFVMREHYVHEIKYEVVPAHGYAADPLPAGGTRTIGTASLTSSFAQQPSGTVVATFTFDSGKTRLTPAEYERFRTDVKAFWTGNAPEVRFHSVGAVALSSGNVREALAAFRKLDAEHPKQALHARQIAETVLATGLGQVARDQAKRAIAADPKDADGERVLGWTLEHDLIGRAYGTSADLAGAEQAYRRAIAVDPKHVLARAALAILLEHDSGGQRSYPAGKLAEIEKLYAGLERDGEKGFQVNRDLVMLYQGRFKEVIERTRTPATDERSSVLFAAVAAASGTAAAIREATSRLAGNDQRSEIMRLTGANLLPMRRYAEAAAFYEQAARDNANGAAFKLFAERLRNTRKHESVKFDLRKPIDVVRAFLVEMIKAGGENRVPTRASVAGLAVPELIDALVAPGQQSTVTDAMRNLAKKSSGVPLVSVIDMLAAVELTVEGRPGIGYRVRLPGSASGMGSTSVWVRAEAEGPRILYMGDDRWPIAREALRLRRAGRLDAARAWLDWLLESETLGSPTDPLSGSRLARVWKQDEAARSAEAIDVAAAVVLATFALEEKVVNDALPILERVYASGATDDRGIATAMALADGFTFVKRFADADRVSAELHKRYPRSRAAAGLRLRVLSLAGNAREALRIAEAEAKARPNDPDATRVLANVQMEAGRLAESEATWKGLIDSGRGGAGDYNDYAWVRLCRNDVGEGTLAAARRAVELSGRQSGPTLHTLASVLAERNEPEQARDTLIESIEQRGSDAITDNDRYVLGRIAESHLFPDSAREIYRQLARPTRAVESSSYALAQRRLQRLPPKK